MLKKSYDLDSQVICFVFENVFILDYILPWKSLVVSEPTMHKYVCFKVQFANIYLPIDIDCVNVCEDLSEFAVEYYSTAEFQIFA